MYSNNSPRPNDLRIRTANQRNPETSLRSNFDHIDTPNTAQSFRRSQHGSRNLTSPSPTTQSLQRSGSFNSPNPTSFPSSPLAYPDSRRSSQASLVPPPRPDHFGGSHYHDDPLQSPASFSARSSFDALRPASPAGSTSHLLDSRYDFPDDEDPINTQTAAAKFTIMPNSSMLLYPEDVEKDDWLHNPTPGDKEKDKFTLFNKRSLTNVGALGFLIFGSLALLVVFPAVSIVERFVPPPPPPDNCREDYMCISNHAPLLKNIRTGLIDPDTPQSAYTRKATDGTPMQLVFSDEFEQDGRSFYGGDDPFFQAVDLWYGVTVDSEWYDPDAVTTRNGVLEIRFDAFQNHGLNYRSGMLQSWNQLCFKGGYLEASISLPASGDTSGLWPGFWSMGNLGRPGYASTTEGLWPYSYWDQCDMGITKNQSQNDGLSFLPGMRLPACSCAGEDHPSPGKSRSAPEIDALEATVLYLDPPLGAAIGSVSQSAQIAPFDIWYQPNYEYVELYDPTVTSMNAYRGGYFQEALSAVTNLNNDWYNGKAYQTYAFEYTPGATGYTTWFVGKDKTWTLDGRAIGPNGNIGQRVISEEPMSIIANLGMSSTFATLNMTGLAPQLPATMRFDYIRIYQREDDVMGCDPPGYPTTDYIRNHAKAYRNRDKQTWESAGYKWPTNTFVDQCTA